MNDYNQYRCEDSFINGEVGEQVAFRYFRKCRNIKAIYDVRSDSKYRDIDTDFVVEDDKGNLVKIEVKTDSYTTGRFCYELWSCIETRSLGWPRKCQADYVFYYFSRWRKAYIFEFKPFYEWCEANIDIKAKRFKKKTQTQRWDGSYYTTDNVYFELSDVEDKEWCKVKQF